MKVNSEQSSETPLQLITTCHPRTVLSSSLDRMSKGENNYLSQKCHCINFQCPHSQLYAIYAMFAMFFAMFAMFFAMYAMFAYFKQEGLGRQNGFHMVDSVCHLVDMKSGKWQMRSTKIWGMKNKVEYGRHYLPYDIYHNYHFY